MMILFAFGMALTNTGITALISNTASDREQGTVLGTSSSLDSLSGILAPPVSTSLLSTFGPAFAGIESLTLSAIALGMGVHSARSEREMSVVDEAAVAALGGEVEVAKIADG